MAKNPSPAVSTSVPRYRTDQRPYHLVMARQERFPRGVADVRGPLRRAHDVREEHRRQHAVEHRLLGVQGRQEAADLPQYRLRRCVPEEVSTRVLDQPRDGDAIGEIARRLHLERSAVTVAVGEDEGRDADRGQHIRRAGVDEPANLGDVGPRSVAVPLHPEEPLSLGRTAEVRPALPRAATPRVADPLVELLPPGSVGHPGCLFGGAVGNVRVDQDQAGDPLGMGGCEELRDQAGVIRGCDHRPLAVGRVQHDPEIVRESLQGRHVTRGEPLRKPPASAVRDDQASLLGEPLQEAREVRALPLEVEVREPSRNQQHIDRPLTKDLICERNVTVPRVLGRRPFVHAFATR